MLGAIGAVLAVVLGLVAITFIAAGTKPAAMAAPHLVPEAATAGIDHAYDGDFEFYVGGGVAVFDCSDDGRPDLYFAGGTNKAPAGA